MMKMLRKKRKGGFTLIELIVVIAILGILAAIAIPRLSGFTNNAEAEAAKATLRTIESGWAIYEAAPSSGAWPGDFVGGAILKDADTITIDTIDYSLDSATDKWKKD